MSWGQSQMTSGTWPFPSRTTEDYFTVLSRKGPDLISQDSLEKAVLRGNPTGFPIPGKGVSNHNAKSKDVGVGRGGWVGGGIPLVSFEEGNLNTGPPLCPAHDLLQIHLCPYSFSVP